MLNLNNKNKRDIGYKGENHIIDFLRTKGFILYSKNIKGINYEIDIVVYRYNHIKNTLDIRIVEVKTRSNYHFNLFYFNLNKKWRLIKPYFFKIKTDVSLYVGREVDTSFYSEIHFDLALVKYENISNRCFVYKYIKDVNLLI